MADSDELRQPTSSAHLDRGEPSLTVIDRPMWHESGVRAAGMLASTWREAPILPAVRPWAETSTRATSLTSPTWAGISRPPSPLVVVGQCGVTSHDPETAQRSPSLSSDGAEHERQARPVGSWRPQRRAASVDTDGSPAGASDPEAVRTRIRYWLTLLPTDRDHSHAAPQLPVATGTTPSPEVGHCLSHGKGPTRRRRAATSEGLGRVRGRPCRPAGLLRLSEVAATGAGSWRPCHRTASAEFLPSSLDTDGQTTPLLSALWQTGSRSNPAVRVIIRAEMPVWSWA